MMNREQIEACRDPYKDLSFDERQGLCDLALGALDEAMTAFPNAARRAVFSVLIERQRQDAKWGADRTLDFGTWVTILGEEYGEVCRAILESRDGVDSVAHVREELVQVAAVAVAAIEGVDRLLRRIT